MMPESNNTINGENDPLRSDRNESNDHLQDASNSDGAAENASESERIREASRASEPANQMETGTDKHPQNRDNANTDEPLTTQGSNEEIEESMSGTTNLTIEQLKREHNPGGYSAEEGKD
jgi:hypothetical protein